MEKFLTKDGFGNDIYLADSSMVVQQKREIDALLMMIGEYMGWEGDISKVFVSDLSSVGDFCLEDSELSELSTKLGFSVGHDDLLHEIATKMRPAS